MGVLRILSWNVCALFYYEFGHRAKAASKMQELKGLARSHHVLLLQEVHGNQGDLATFQREFSDFRVFFSPGPTNGTGGVAILIRDLLFEQVDHHVEVVVAAGRCLSVRLHGPRGLLTFMSVHIDPNLTIEHKKGFIQRCAGELNNGGLWIMGGDFNHEVPGERRINAKTGTPIARHEPEAEFFQETFDNAIEMHTDDSTHIVSHHGQAVSIGRLDRMYTNLPALELLDAKPTTRALHNLYKQPLISDHSPISTTFNTNHNQKKYDNGNANENLQEWVIKNPAFTGFFHQVLNDHPNTFTNDPFHNLEILKQAMKVAAILLKHHMVESRSASTSAEQTLLDDEALETDPFQQLAGSCCSCSCIPCTRTRG